MTIEEKAKAYDEALERAKNIKSKILQSHLSTESCKAVSEYIDEIIPELCESEDERIRKAIISLVHENCYAYKSFVGVELCDMLSYLEKQKEQKSTVWTEEDEEIREHLINICNEWIDGGWSARPCLNDIKWLKNILERQKEQKSVDYDHEMWKNCEANFEGGKKEVIEHPEKYGLQKEQKPTISDEAIHEGIVHFGITQYQIDNWLKKHINIVEQKPISFNEPYNPDDYEVVMEGNATSLKRKDQKSIEDVIKNITKNKESAIKFLKSAGIMDDNGELAEMYRSEQKSADHCSIRDEFDLDGNLKGLNYDNRIQYHSVKGGIESFASTYSFNIESKLFPQLTKEQQQLWREEIEQAVVAGGENGVGLARDNRYKENRMVEWSEEDKTRLTNILIMLQEYVIHHYSKDDVNKSVDWLKALPERFNLQLKPEWSEEEKGILLECVSVLQNSGRWVLADKLLSLRPQSYWKPREAQMEALEECGECKRCIKELREQLKKLM